MFRIIPSNFSMWHFNSVLKGFWKTETGFSEGSVFLSEFRRQPLLHWRGTCGTKQILEPWRQFLVFLFFFLRVAGRITFSYSTTSTVIYAIVLPPAIVLSLAMCFSWLLGACKGKNDVHNYIGLWGRKQKSINVCPQGWLNGDCHPNFPEQFF